MCSGNRRPVLSRPAVSFWGRQSRSRSMNRRTGFAAAVVGLALGLGFAGPAPAQDYPSRAITLIVPYPAGGGVDAMARIVGGKLSAALGQQAVVDNRGGGVGTICAPPAAHSPAAAASPPRL